MRSQSSPGSGEIKPPKPGVAARHRAIVPRLMTRISRSGFAA
jgi:hypothetical protein